MKPCSILISSFRPREAIELCIESILKRTKYPEFEIIVYDSSGDTDTTRKYLDRQEENGKIKLITVPTWAEHGEAVNNLISCCQTPLACLLDSDVEIIEDDWLVFLTSMINGVGVSKYLEAGLRFGTTLYAPVYWPPCMLLDMDIYRKLGEIDWKIKWIPINKYSHMDIFKAKQISMSKHDYIVGDTGWRFADKILFDNLTQTTI